jgi:hypothetical protein
MADKENVEVWGASAPEPQKAPQKATPQERAGAVKALSDIYENLNSAPKYLRITQLVQSYNMARNKFEQQDFAYVLTESKRTKEILNKMKDEYNGLALTILQIQDQVQECKSSGLALDYDYMLKMLDKCTNVLKSGELESGSRLINKFARTFEEQREAAIRPARQEIQSNLDSMKVLLEEAKREGLETGRVENRFNEIIRDVPTVNNLSKLQTFKQYCDEIAKHLKATLNERRLKEELPKQTSRNINSARLELYELRKAGMEIDTLEEIFDRCSDMFDTARAPEDFEKITAELERLQTMMAEHRSALEKILEQRKVLEAKLQAKRASVR